MTPKLILKTMSERIINIISPYSYRIALSETSSPFNPKQPTTDHRGPINSPKQPITDHRGLIINPTQLNPPPHVSSQPLFHGTRGQVNQSPCSARVQGRLISTERPHVKHSQDFIIISFNNFASRIFDNHYLLCIETKN